jgi:phage-related protein
MGLIFVRKNANNTMEGAMAAIKVVMYKEDDESVPLFEWLDHLRPPKALAKCRVLVDLLKQFGPDLRRPYADFLRDGIHELRTHYMNVQYRMLYFFHKQTAVITHDLIKAGKQVSPKEIDLAVERKKHFEIAPQRHMHEE